jgi:hypothetical protein
VSKWVIDTESGTILKAESCVVIDDAHLSDEDNFALDMACSDAETIEIGERRGTPVLNYRDPDNVYIVWCPEDVQELLAGYLTYDEATEALQKVGKHLVDRSIEEGWVILETLLDTEGYSIGELSARAED